MSASLIHFWQQILQVVRRCICSSILQDSSMTCLVSRCYYIPPWCLTWSQMDLILPDTFPFPLTRPVEFRTCGKHISSPLFQLSVMAFWWWDKGLEAFGCICPSHSPQLADVNGMQSLWPHIGTIPLRYHSAKTFSSIIQHRIQWSCACVTMERYAHR